MPTSLDLSGLAAIAGQPVPRMDFPLWNVDVGAGGKALYQGVVEAAKMHQAYAQQQNLANIASQQQQGENQRAVFNAGENRWIEGQKLQQLQAQLEQSRLFHNDQMGLEQYKAKNQDAYQQAVLGQGDQRNKLDQQRLDNSNTYEQGLLDQGKQRTAMEEQKMKIEQAKALLDEHAKMSDEQRNRQASFAGAVYRAAQQYGANSPEFIHASQQIANEAVQSGDMSKEEAQQMLSRSPQDLVDFSAAKILYAQKASDLKDMIPGMSTKDAASQAKKQDEVQALTFARDSLQAYNDFGENNPDLFGKGVGTAVVGMGEEWGNAMGIPTPTGSMDIQKKKELLKTLHDQAIEAQRNAMKFTRVNPTAIKHAGSLVGSMEQPSVENFKNIVGSNIDFMNKQIDAKAGGQASESSSASSNPSSSKFYSKADIAALAAHNNVSPSEIVADMEAKGYKHE